MDPTVEKYFKENNINFKGSELSLLKPLYDYVNDDRLPANITSNLAQLNYIKATPIQAISIPMLLEGKDFIGISQTGSGKTLAFVLPAFVKFTNGSIAIESNFNGPCRPSMMVLSPTRELALQTKEVIDNFKLFKAVCLYGGSPRYEQINFIKSHRPNIVVGTPGRVNDFIDSNIVDCDQVKYLVLDEADRMFDMGFYPQISQIISHCTSNQRQTLLFSATWEGKVETLASPFMKPDRVFTCIGQLELKANQDIKQHLFLCSEAQKKILLKKILKEFFGYKVIVFANTKAKASELSFLCELDTMGRAEFIHGDVDQFRRTRLVKDFDNGKFTVLFATDVASRGLDINDINVVVNFDIPNEIETYVHRIGRTGRNGRKGKAFSFVTPNLFKNLNSHSQLIKVVRESGNVVPDNILF